jgi:uncharacterized protein DUF6090
MQDEIAKHGKNIYDTVKNPRHSFSEKLKDVAIEIFIIVFAVTLSIWLHNWSEHKQEQKEAKKFLAELKEDLVKDIELFKKDRQTSSELDSNFNYILSLKKNQVSDTALGPYTDLKDFSTNFNKGRYEGFKSIGKIGTIENDSLKNRILSYYEQTIPNLVTYAAFVNAEQMKILNAGQNEMGNLSLNDFLITKKMHSMYYFLEYNFRQIILSYEAAIKQAATIIEEINEETK